MNGIDTPGALANASEEPAPARPKKRKVMLLAPLLLLLLVIGAIWYFADLSSFKSPERVAAAARALRESRLGFLYVLLAFAAGTLLFFPVTALIMGTTLAFDPTRGFSYAFAGALLGTSITYWVGRMLGSSALDYVSGPKMTKLGEQLRAHAFRASIVARLMPVGNFTAINLLAGSLRIPFRAFFFGNVIGIFPGVLAFTFFADKITDFLQAPSKSSLILLGAGVALLVALSFGLSHLSKRRERALKASGGTRS